jgi:hypothetical protein
LKQNNWLLINIVPAFGYISPFHYEDTASIGARLEQLAFSIRYQAKFIYFIKSNQKKLRISVLSTSKPYLKNTA